MPTPPVTWAAANTAGEAFANVVASMLADFQNGYTTLGPLTYTLELDTADGLRRMKLRLQGTTYDAYTAVWAILGQAATEVISARELMQQVGFVTTNVLNMDLQTGTPPPGYTFLTFDDVFSNWQRIVGTGKSDIIDQWSTGTAAAPSQSHDVQIAGHVDHCLSYMEVQASSQRWLTQDALRMTNAFATSGVAFGTAPEISMQQPIVTVSGLKELVDVLNQIALQDATFSINQGAAAWSVKSGVVVGP